MREIKRIDVLSAGKIAAVLGAVVGLFYGAIASLVAIVGGMGVASGGGNGAGASIIVGAGAIICMPIFFAVGGFIGGLLEAFVYNLIAGTVGGLKIELSE